MPKSKTDVNDITCKLEDYEFAIINRAANALPDLDPQQYYTCRNILGKGFIKTLPDHVQVDIESIFEELVITRKILPFDQSFIMINDRARLCYNLETDNPGHYFTLPEYISEIGVSA